MELLSKRLKAAASLVPEGSRVADIGTDHGRLAIYLRLHGIAKEVIAADIREKPLKNALRNIANCGVDRVQCRLCNGFDGISPDEIDAAVIAGMGGEVIAGIIDRAPWLKERKTLLILQPMTSAEYLRAFLCDNGFNTERELTACENSRVYTVIPAVYNGALRKCKLLYLYAGNRDFETPEGRIYARKQYLRLKGEEQAWVIKGRKAEYDRLCEQLKNLSYPEDQNGV